MNQEWFEMPEVRRRTFADSVWIPLRAENIIKKNGTFGHLGYEFEFFGAGSLAVPVSNKADAEKLDWTDIGISHSHTGFVQDGKYIPSNIYEDTRSDFIGEHLVLKQRMNSNEKTEWHLNQDFVITLGLKREKDVWVRPDEGYIEVAKLLRQEDGSPYLIEVRSVHLRDYLCVRDMALYITSYRHRQENCKDSSQISWRENPMRDINSMDKWEGRIGYIHEGGMPFGTETAVIHSSRTDVHPDDDVPTFDYSTDKGIESESWTVKEHGQKLCNINGELWRNEWIDPSPNSPIIRGDKLPPTVHFQTNEKGEFENKSTLKNGIRWLWFSPNVAMALVDRRGGSLNWYTKYTGSMGCSPDDDIHFGINKLGLVNVLASDIGDLPDWQQKIWAAHNVGPEGKVSIELLASQMKAKPAETKAPEDYLSYGLNHLNEVSQNKLGISLLRYHSDFQDVLLRTHRFRAVDRVGLFALAKDIARLTADSFDTKAIQTIIKPPKGDARGSLKSLEFLLASKIDPDIAKSILNSLFGAYELRLADAHLQSGEIDESYKKVGVDQSAPYVHQGVQLLSTCVSSIFRIIDSL